MSWWCIVKKDYTGQLDGFLQTMGSLKEQVNDAQTIGLEMDYGRDLCCENAMARVLDLVEMEGRIVTSKGQVKTGKEAAEHVSNYDCDKLRLFVEHNATKAKASPQYKEEFKQILEDWKDCEGDESGY